MNGKPHELQEDTQEDLLEQIITQGLNKMKAPAQAAAVEDAPAEEKFSTLRQKDREKTALPADKKNRRSAVYLYLLILFGAAFLLLLLAYFIQQSSSETTISDLRDSMNLSREDLLTEIKDLEDKNAILEEKNNVLDEELDRMRVELAQWERYGEEAQETIDLWNQVYTDALVDLYSWSSFWELERYYQAEDHESCAAVLILQEQGQYRYRTPDDALERYDEIVLSVIDKGILAEDYPAHISDYDDLIDAFLAEHTAPFLSIGC